MRRRAFFASVAGLLLVGVGQAKDNNLRDIFKLVNGQKIKCRMKELRPGDTCIIEEDGKVISLSKVLNSPSKDGEGHWQIQTEELTKELVVDYMAVVNAKPNHSEHDIQLTRTMVIVNGQMSYLAKRAWVLSDGHLEVETYLVEPNTDRKCGPCVLKVLGTETTYHKPWKLMTVDGLGQAISWRLSR